MAAAERKVEKKDDNPIVIVWMTVDSGFQQILFALDTEVHPTLDDFAKWWATNRQDMSCHTDYYYAFKDPTRNPEPGAAPIPGLVYLRTAFEAGPAIEDKGPFHKAAPVLPDGFDFETGIDNWTRGLAPRHDARIIIEYKNDLYLRIGNRVIQHPLYKSEEDEDGEAE
jgi:hypothetical protein